MTTQFEDLRTFLLFSSGSKSPRTVKPRNAMRYPFLSSLLLICCIIALPVEVAAQGPRLLIISSKVGAEIDLNERTTYDLFEGVNDFQSAWFYQMPDSSFWVGMKLQAPEGSLRDTACKITYATLRQCAEKVQFRSELLRGSYLLGSTNPEIFYADGTLLHPPPSLFVKTPHVPIQPFDDFYLPLVAPEKGVSRPKFATIRLELSIGFALGSFHDLELLTGQVSDAFIPISFGMEVPLFWDRTLSVVGGWGFALGGAGTGSLTGFNTALLYRMDPHSSLTPIIGFGASENWYSVSSSDIIISASLVSPVLQLGLVLDSSMLDLMLSIPLRTSMSTSFESKTYTIDIAAKRLTLVIAF